MTHHLPLLAMLLLALAASTLLSTARTPPPQAAFAMATGTQRAPATPYGSGAAMRSLLF